MMFFFSACCLFWGRHLIASIPGPTVLTYIHVYSRNTTLALSILPHRIQFFFFFGNIFVVLKSSINPLNLNTKKEMQVKLTPCSMISSVTQNSTKMNCIIGQWERKKYFRSNKIFGKKHQNQTNVVGWLSFALKTW